MNKENLLKTKLDEISDEISSLNSQTKAIKREIFAKKLKIPDRFLPREHDPDYGYIDAERLNTEFKILEDRVNKLERGIK